MSTFQHPHLIRGVVQTPQGAFALSRGRVEMADDVGAALGWRRIDRDGESSESAQRSVREPSEGGAAATGETDRCR